MLGVITIKSLMITPQRIVISSKTQMPSINGGQYTSTEFATNALAMGTYGKIAPHHPLHATCAILITTQTSNAAQSKGYHVIHHPTPNDNQALNAPQAFRDIRYSHSRLAVRALSFFIITNLADQSKVSPLWTIKQPTPSYIPEWSKT